MTRAEAVEFIREANRRFNGEVTHIDMPTVREVRGDSVELWAVGRNASHEFYAGVGQTGQLYRMSIGEEWPETEEGDAGLLDEEPELVEHIAPVTDFDGYYGHC